jgi:hypothetical protein
MVVNNYAGSLIPRAVLESIASGLAAAWTFNGHQPL